MAEPEQWQRGPVTGVPMALQPAAHILLQLREELPPYVRDLPVSVWNARPAGVASITFHVKHIAGVLDRMATYARGDLLDDAQQRVKDAEGAPMLSDERAPLLTQLDAQIERSLTVLRNTDPATLGDFRGVGRSGLPSTVIGCLMHGAEHGMRHLGQVIVTARVAEHASS